VDVSRKFRNESGSKVSNPYTVGASTAPDHPNRCRSKASLKVKVAAFSEVFGRQTRFLCFHTSSEQTELLLMFTVCVCGCVCEKQTFAFRNNSVKNKVTSLYRKQIAHQQSCYKNVGPIRRPSVCV